MADLVLATDNCAVGHLSAQGDALLCADGWKHQRALRDARHAAEQEDGCLQRPEEQARPRKEEVPCSGQMEGGVKWVL